jgi:hypothetical protein
MFAQEWLLYVTEPYTLACMEEYMSRRTVAKRASSPALFPVDVCLLVHCPSCLVFPSTHWGSAFLCI